MLSVSLNRLVLAQASRTAWVARDNAPNTFADLRQAWHDTGLVIVSPDACETSIYGDANVNMAFRAWHDSLHLAHNLEFTPDDEKQVARLQCACAGIPRDKALLWADVAGQVEYFERYREFPADQVSFVLDYLACGIVRKRF